MECFDCKHEVEINEHYIEMFDETILCETCFWNRAVKFMVAKEKQNQRLTIEDED